MGRLLLLPSGLYARARDDGERAQRDAASDGGRRREKTCRTLFLSRRSRPRIWFLIEMALPLGLAA